MKSALLSIVTFLLAASACTETATDKVKPCLVRISYIDYEKLLNPPAIRVDFVDRDTLIGKNAKNEQYKSILFYSVEEESRSHFWLKPNYYEHAGDTTSLFFVIGRSDSIDIQTMSPKSIERLLFKKGLGFVKGSDTTMVLPCKQ